MVVILSINDFWDVLRNCFDEGITDTICAVLHDFKFQVGQSLDVKFGEKLGHVVSLFSNHRLDGIRIVSLGGKLAMELNNAPICFSCIGSTISICSASYAFALKVVVALTIEIQDK